MYELTNAKLMWLYGLTSAHVGSGDNLSYVDLPIQREKHTGFPKIEASSLKGAIRHHVEKEKGKSDAESIFGKGSGEEDGSASEVAFSDARILFFPVKSAKGIFAWATCPMVVKQFERDCKIIGKKITTPPSLDCREDAVCTGKSLKISGNKVMLEELVFESTTSKEEELVTWLCNLVKKFPLPAELPEDFKSRVILIPNEDFKYFVMQATEVITRIKVGEDGVVEDGALFTEEYLPPESLMYSLLFLKKGINDQDKTTLETHLDDSIVQIGGNATLGKGLFSIKYGDKSPEGSDEPCTKE